MSTALPPQTREELLADRARQIRGLRAVAVVLALVGTLVCIAGAGALAFGHTPMLLGAGATTLVFAGLSGARARLRARVPIPDAPAHRDLPHDDPRVSVPLATRRRTWLVAAAGWASTLLAAGLAVRLMGPASPALMKLAVFLGAPGLALALGARAVRRRNGTHSWPT